MTWLSWIWRALTFIASQAFASLMFAAIFVLLPLVIWSAALAGILVHGLITGSRDTGFLFWALALTGLVYLLLAGLGGILFALATTLIQALRKWAGMPCWCPLALALVPASAAFAAFSTPRAGVMMFAALAFCVYYLTFLATEATADFLAIAVRRRATFGNHGTNTKLATSQPES